MQNVFNYDSLLFEIQRLAAHENYETGERIITRIVKACTVYVEIISLKIILRKQPAPTDSGSLGVIICMERAALDLVWHAKSR
jgi:dihydroneopterin aldolase